MKKYLALLLALVMLLSLGLTACSSTDEGGEGEGSGEASGETGEPAGGETGGETGEWTPDGPITILNYVATGGAMDLATRKFVEIASKYTDATFVVDNMTGASGMIAADHILDQPADGQLIYATTVTYIYGVAAAEEDAAKYIDGFEWIDNIMADPYCILVPAASDYTLQSLVDEAKAGNQIWCEPNAGGAKHIAAIQMAKALGINPQVVPYESGPLAINAVLGGQGAASVGNPGDTTKYDVKALVVGNNGRLAGFDVPTFTELGFPAELDALSMWRGYAVKKGTPAGMITWFQDLCQKVTEDPDWINYYAEQFVAVKNDTTETFTAT
ncbi:MAG: tripartite tricarboxylate transporter substrate binding protein, partial [Clostridia bacterium]|nr:tripartite tricarboxylate transporter substrate binding protein [Clostridia bacterium]